MKAKHGRGREIEGGERYEGEKEKEEREEEGEERWRIVTG